MDKDNLDTVVSGDNKALTKKHIAERQRRARINTYLEEIQRLTSTGTSTISSSKLEKAEVLERAVSFLEKTQKTVDPNNNSGPCENNMDTYKKGFASCMTNLFDHVTQSQDLHMEAPHLKRHLDNFLQNHVTQFDHGGNQPGMSSFNQNVNANTNSCYSGGYVKDETMHTARHQLPVQINHGFNQSGRMVSNPTQELYGRDSIQANAHAARRGTDYHRAPVHNYQTINGYTVKTEPANYSEHDSRCFGDVSYYRESNMVVNVGLSNSELESNAEHAHVSKSNTNMHATTDTTAGCGGVIGNFDIDSFDAMLEIDEDDTSKTRSQEIWRPW